MRIDKPTKDAIPALRALWKESFSDPDAFIDLFFRTAFSPDRCRCITEGDEILAALYFFDAEADGRRIAYLYAIATRKAHRGKGLCRMFMEDTHRYLSTEGYAGALLVPGSDALFDFYEKMGYKTATFLDSLEASASESKISLKRVGRDEYAVARRRLLPPRGVIQEGESLAFLETMAELYIADGVALAAREEPEGLYGIELLGDRALAPDILFTLGYAKGSFRTLGDTVPFSMYLPLTVEEHAPPSHYGFAFD